MTTFRQLLEAGVHFGHHVSRCNPKMKPYIHSVRGESHIINLPQTQAGLQRACEYLRHAKEEQRNIVFVGTKIQAQEIIASEARRCGAHYVNQRWLGGTLTNFETLKKRIEWLYLFSRQHSRLEKRFSGLLDLRVRPDVLFVIDQSREAIALKEAHATGCFTIALVDTDSDPEGIDIVIPGNDDSMRSVHLITQAIADAMTGLSDSDDDPGPGPDLHPAPVPRRPLPYAGLLEIALALPDAEPDYLND